MDDIRWAIAQEIPHLRRYARGLTGDAWSADDLVQASLERALRKHRLWRRRGSLRSWLLRIVYRTFLNDLQQGRRHVPLDDAAAGEAMPTPEASQETRLEALDIVRSLERLPVQQRAVLLLVAVEDLSYDEVAEVLGVPIGTVRSRLSRARESLRAWTDPAAEEDTPTPSHLRRVK
ncbi:MAG: RNA polymerase sigma factor [Alphaproteobacteria bacterium]